MDEISYESEMNFVVLIFSFLKCTAPRAEF